VKGGNTFPNILKRNEELKDSPICNAALSLKKEFFNIRWGRYAMRYYVNINALINADNTGIKQKIEPYENKIFDETNIKLNEWRLKGNKKSDIKLYYEKLNTDLINLYTTEFNIKLR